MIIVSKHAFLRTLKLERWQGPPHVNKVKLYEMLFIQSFSHIIADYK